MNSRKMRLAIISSHPIQYNAPLFKLLAERNYIDLKVFYTWGQAKEKVYDPGFGKERKWDIPLLDGYKFEFIKNVSSNPGSSHFKGIINPDLIEKIKLFNPDAILFYGWNFQSHLKAIRYFKNKIPVWFRGDSTLIDEKGQGLLKKVLRRITLTWVFKHIDVAFFVGTANKAYFVKHGLNEKQLIFAPHAIDYNRFNHNPDDSILKAKNWRKQLGIPQSAFVFLFAGKLEPKKNPGILVSAFKKLKSEQNHLILVGNGILENSLKFDALECKNIHFINFQNQQMMPIVYRIGDVFVLPSQGPGETWGLAVNEAMASGLPVIVSDKCGCNLDLIKENINGFVFKSNNENELIENLSNFISGKHDIKQMGRNSQNIISKWNYEQICSTIENKLTEIYKF